MVFLGRMNNISVDSLVLRLRLQLLAQLTVSILGRDDCVKQSNSLD